MNAFLLTWNPKYYDPHRELRILKERGDCFANWRTNTRQIEAGDELYLMRQGSEPRGIVARAHAIARNLYIQHEGHWYVSLRWTWFEPEDPMFTLDDLRMLFPDQHWSPRGSGIRIKPPVDEEFVELFNKAWYDNRNKTSEK